MSGDKDKLEPMDASLSDLLRRGAPPVDAPGAARERVFARLAAALPLGGGGGDGGGGGSPGATHGASAVSGKMLGAIAISLSVGAGIGAVVARATTPERVRTVYVDRTPAPASTPVDDAVRVEDLPRAPPEGSASSRSRTSTASPPSPLNAERAVLDEARTAFARGDNERCLQALDQHRSRYPTGLLSEEREALAVRVLAALGRTTEAQERGREFLIKYPNSLMALAVRGALGQLPEPP